MKTVTAENEARARKLLDQGYLAGRVAEMVGISITAVDRINGSTPEPDRTRYGQPLDVKHAAREEHPDPRPAALRKETAVVTHTPPPVAPRPAPERPSGGFIPPLYDYQLSAKIGEPPPATVELQCLALDHAWTWTVTPGHPPMTCTEHRGYKALTCDGCGETFYYERKGGTVALYCSPACRARKAPRTTPPAPTRLSDRSALIHVATLVEKLGAVSGELSEAIAALVTAWTESTPAKEASE